MTMLSGKKGGACEQGRSKVFTTGQARFNPEQYVIKCVGGR